ncbi:MAG: YcjX family protein [Gammaproteobacteria bacterium]|nr:YcjX family protein [Gammaproteobacteria bacterium]
MIFQGKKLKLGVTGFSRTGKTVFIGSLTHSLLTSDSWANKKGRGPLAQFSPFELGKFSCASIRDDVHSDLPQFPFRKVRDSLIYEHAGWPQPTDGISHLVLELFYQKKGFINFFDCESSIQLELVDYPGEWLVDLPMLQQTYDEWSDDILQKASAGSRSAWSKGYLNALNHMDENTDDESTIERLSDLWEQYLTVAADNGLVFNQPGKLLRPGNMRHSPVLRLVPLPTELRSGKLSKRLKKRYKEYQDKVIRPFYKSYFSTIDRQIVLVDVLRTLQLGKEAYTEITEGLKVVLKSFNYGKGSLLDWLTGHNTTHVLFAATKADHVTRTDRANLEKVLRKMVRQVDDNNQFKSSVKHQSVMEIASVKASEDRMTVKSPKREILFGKPVETDKAQAYDPGCLPLDVPPDWENMDYQFLNFLPATMPDALDEGFPSINMGKALNFLIGDDFH